MNIDPIDLVGFDCSQEFFYIESRNNVAYEFISVKQPVSISIFLAEHRWNIFSRASSERLAINPVFKAEINAYPFYRREYDGEGRKILLGRNAEAHQQGASLPC